MFKYLEERISCVSYYVCNIPTNRIVQNAAKLRETECIDLIKNVNVCTEDVFLLGILSFWRNIEFEL